MSEKTTHRPNPTQTTLWQIAQIALLTLFCFLLYRAESRVLTDLRPNYLDQMELEIKVLLKHLQWNFLPGQFWRLGWPLGLVTISLVFFTKWRWYFLSAGGVVTYLLMTGDRINYHFLGSLVSADSFQVAGQVWAVRESVFPHLGFMDLLYILAFLAMSVFGWFKAKHQPGTVKKGPRIFLIEKGVGLLAAILVIHALYLALYVPVQHFRVDLGTEDQTGEKVRFRTIPPFESSSRAYANYFGLLNYHLSDFHESLTNRLDKEDPDPKSLQMVADQLAKYKTLNDRSSPLQGVARGRNVVLISLEAFQTFLLDLKLAGKEVTPNLNALQKHSLVWRNTIDNVRSGGTSDAEFSVMTGLLPDNRKIAAMNHPTNNQLLALPLSLKQKGYHTYSFHGNEPSFWRRHLNHPAFGIETMHFGKQFKAPIRGLGVPDQPFFQESADFLKDAPSPFFAFLITVTSHHPYHALPPDYQHVDFGLPEKSQADGYLQSVHYADRALGDFIDRLKAQGRWENTMFVLYGDHAAPLEKEGKQTFLNDLQINTESHRAFTIPLVIAIPGAEADLREHGAAYTNAVGSLHDIFPTVLHLLGEAVPYGLSGTHLLVPNEARSPLPWLKFQGFYINRGGLFRGAGPKPLTDDLGVIFTEPPPIDETAPQGGLPPNQEATLMEAIHHYLFDFDAQRHAIQLYKNGKDAKEVD